MGVSQIKSSFQNDGNFSQLDLRDEVANGPLMRIETFRCSQPEGEFGTTASGTSVLALAGTDHLTESSNRTFRHVFSSGNPDDPTVSLEIRETYDEDGSFEVRTRDVDGESGTFGRALITKARPSGAGVEILYELRRPDSVPRAHISSPLKGPIRELAPGLADLGDEVDALGSSYAIAGVDRLSGILVPGGDNTALNGDLGPVIN